MPDTANQEDSRDAAKRKPTPAGRFCPYCEAIATAGEFLATTVTGKVATPVI